MRWKLLDEGVTFHLLFYFDFFLMPKIAEQLLVSQSPVSPREVALELGCGEGSRGRFRCSSGPEAVKAGASARGASPAWSSVTAAPTPALTSSLSRVFSIMCSHTVAAFGGSLSARCQPFQPLLSLFPPLLSAQAQKSPLGKTAEAFGSAHWSPGFICNLHFAI